MNHPIHSSNALTWEALTSFANREPDRLQGPTNSYSKLRLFHQAENTVRVTLYRDHHAWCPYCQKVWLWLEWKEIPYRVKKVTMRCYGKKERWYLKKVPSGMLPAIEIDNQLFTESDEILLALEKVFGPLGMPLEGKRSLELRKLERKLFRSWCSWLCRPNMNEKQELQAKEQFHHYAKEMEIEILKGEGPWLDKTKSAKGTLIPGSSDVIFIPYVERMNASLAYYKGLNLRREHPAINIWLTALEQLSVYRGTKGDFHTHAHDLPPQMGGCWKNASPNQYNFSKAIDCGEGLGELEDVFLPEKGAQDFKPENDALTRVLKHRLPILKTNPMGENSFDQPLRAALTRMITGSECIPNKGSASGLRYLRDRISVPRDMPLLSARKLRQALEKTAEMDSFKQGESIPLRNRFDQNPEPFLTKNAPD